MKGIAKGSGAYFVVDDLFGVRVLFAGSLAECREYCRANGIPTKIVFDW